MSFLPLSCSVHEILEIKAKTIFNQERHQIKGPGDFVCTDHLISAQPGLLPRISGHHTRERITSACVFKDAYYDFTYAHLQTSCDLEQTINAKIAFEKLADSYGVKVKHYHADNRRFSNNGFAKVCDSSH